MIRRATREPHMVDLLDRILDKGIVIDVWARVVLAGVDLGIRWEARMVVTSIDTYLKHAGPVGLVDPVAWRFAPRNLALK
ncbi:MAG: gas vesicle protein GvpA [Acidobacteria bacterium]|nr:MAG: gas vesicle protein GvpA [Acidobacteriota bacterium]